MNKIAKEFAKNAKAFFPIYTYREREYIKNLELNIEDYCEDNYIDSLEDLYQKYGNPSDVVHSYFSNCNSEYVLKQLRLAKTIKLCIASIIIAIFVALSAYCVRLYSEYQVLAEQQIYFEENTIE